MSYIEDKTILEDAKQDGGWWKIFILIAMVIKMILLVMMIYLGISFMVTIW